MGGYKTMKRTINYGKHAAGSSNRKVNEVTLTVSVEPSKYYDPKTKKDFTKGEHFSVCGDVWNASHTDIIRGGQCVDHIVKHYAKDENSRNIRALWEVFHCQQMDAIPERFRAAIVNFVNGNNDSVQLDRKRCAAYLLKVTEKVTDYGTYTEGTITIKTPDGITEVITLGQGDEIQHPITERAHKVINWLYTDAPTIEDLSSFTIEFDLKYNGGSFYVMPLPESSLSAISIIPFNIKNSGGNTIIGYSSNNLYYSNWTDQNTGIDYSNYVGQWTHIQMCFTLNASNVTCTWKVGNEEAVTKAVNWKVASGSGTTAPFNSFKAIKLFANKNAATDVAIDNIMVYKGLSVSEQ
jgi:hypothetical protein